LVEPGRRDRGSNWSNSAVATVVTYPAREWRWAKRRRVVYPPRGRFATFVAVSGGGYTLTDKNGTVFRFTQPTATSRVFGLVSVADAAGRTETLAYTGGRVSAVTSASGRTLRYTWLTPTGASAPHVATVVTDPVTSGDLATALTWTYSYSGDQLAKVCPPTSAMECTTYTATSGSQYPTTVLDADPHSYWRLGESSGVKAASAVLANAGTDAADYTDVTLGQTGPLAGSAATAAGFNGTSSLVSLPNSLVANGSYQSVSLWFKTTAANGVLFSYQADPVANGTTLANYTPALYIGSSGKLHGEFWYAGGVDGMVSSAPVTDGQWHHVALTGSGGTQSMYLDGTAVGTKTGLIQMYGTGGGLHGYLGAGFIGHAWPDQVHNGENLGSVQHFSGSIAEVSFYNQGLAAGTVGQMYAAGRATVPLLTSVTTPAGRVAAQVVHDPVAGTVRQTTDANGGVWKVAEPTVSGSSQVYAGAVLGSAPSDYWRLGETGGAAEAANQINSHWAYYSSVTQGVEGIAGPGEDTAASFNGTSSNLEVSSASTSSNGTFSAELWFSTTTAPGILLGYQETRLGSGVSNCSPTVYIGTDGKLYGGFTTSSGLVMNTSAGTVTDGKWHHVVLTAQTTSVSLYLDGNLVRTASGGTVNTSESYVYIGAGHSATGGPGLPNQTDIYFTGSIDEVAFYPKTLTGAEVTAHYNAVKSSTGATPAVTVNVTDPGGKSVAEVYDPLNDNRLVAHTDGQGFTTRYGYDTGGFLRTVTDPNGNVTTTGHDVRGNEVSRTTCSFTPDYCSTTYYTYFPDATTKTLTPDPRNDLVLTVRDGRSASATDNFYLTSMTYDTAGNRTGVTTPPVVGYPSGRTLITAFTTPTTAADGGGVTPAGLPTVTTSPGGANVAVTYRASGDIATVTDAVGQITRFTYDGIGRVLTTTTVSDAYPGGLTTTFTHDRLGRVLTQTNPPVTNRVSGATHAAETTTVYDADGNILSKTVADLTGGDAPRITSNTYNDHGQTASTTAADGTTTTFGYDVYGNTAKRVDAAGNDTRFDFDANAHLLTATLKGFTGDPTDPSDARDLVLESRAYDPAGRLAVVTDSIGRQTEYQYHDNGLLAHIIRQFGEYSFYDECDYYDGAGYLASRDTNDDTVYTEYTVDAAGRTVSQTVDPYETARTTTYTYSADDRVLRTVQSDPSGATLTTDASYDAMGRRTSQTVFNVGGAPPAGWWKLDEASGTTAADASGAGHTVTFTGGPALGGGAATFNGSGGGVATGPALDTTGSFTVSAWANLTDTTWWHTVASQQAAVNSGFYLQYSKDDNRWALGRNTTDTVNAPSMRALSTTAPTLGEWTHLVGVFDAADGDMRLYVNGQAQGTATDPTPFAATGPVRIGWAKYSNTDVDWFKGQISNVQAYQRTMSASEIAALYSAGRSGGAVTSSKLTTTWTLDQRGLARSMIDPNGKVTTFDYDEAGRAVLTVAPTVTTETAGDTPDTGHPVTTVGYNTFGERTETSDPNGNVTVTGFDAAGRPTSITGTTYTPPGSSTPITPVTRIGYDRIGRPTTVTDPLGHTTIATYDQLGNLATTTAADGGVTHSTYDTAGEVLSSTDPTGARIEATYDLLGRMITQTEVVRRPTSAAHTTTATYDRGGWLASITTPGGATTTQQQNSVGETTSVTDGVGNITQYQYDLAGRQVATILPDGSRQTTTYDGASRPLSAVETKPDGTVLRTTSVGYDDNSNPVTATDARGTTTTFTYDAANRLTTEVQPTTATTAITTSFGYDAAGNRTRFTDGRGNPFLTTYNSLGLPESTIEPATAAYPNPADRTFTRVYDAAGRVVTQRSPGGVSVTNSYDDANRITGQTGTGAETATVARSYGYDRAGRLTSASAPGGTDTFDWDDRGLLLATTGPSGTSSFAYTGDGQMASRTDAAGTSAYSYDTAGRLKVLTDASTRAEVSYGYNSLSQPTTATYGASGNVRTLGYDPLRRLASDTLTTSAGTGIASITYGYDLNDNETSKTTTGFASAGMNTYGYDLANRLTSWNYAFTAAGYEYDAAGNRTRSGGLPAAYDARNQLQTDGTGRSYTHTARGTLAGVTLNDQTTTTTSDAFGQTITDGARTYTYDSLQRLVTATTGGTTTKLAYSGAGNDVAADGTSTYSRDQNGGLIGVKTGASAVLAYLDQHTDVVGQFTSTGNGLAGSANYDPFGTPINATNRTGNLGYQSGWTDPTTNQVNMWSRWYNPSVGQFSNRDTIAVDPVPNSAAANRYAYADASPMTNTDPTGHCVEDACVVEIGAAIVLRELAYEITRGGSPAEQPSIR
jgi:RHS repeat-associated protein